MNNRNSVLAAWVLAMLVAFGPACADDGTEATGGGTDVVDAGGDAKVPTDTAPPIDVAILDDVVVPADVPVDTVAQSDVPTPDVATPDVATDTGPVDAGQPTEQEQILAVPVGEAWTLEGLSAPVQVIRTEANVPHIYAENRNDLAFAFGFVSARDRFFMMDLARRLGLGTLSELLGDVALESDMQVRANGQRAIALKTAETLPDELGSAFDSFAAGVNAYIEQVAAGKLPAPTELELVGPLLGKNDPSELMVPFDRLSLAGIVVVAQYEASFETGDVGRTATRASLDSLFQGAPFEELRRLGARKDMWEHFEPIVPIASAPSSVPKQGGSVPPLPPPVAGSPDQTKMRVPMTTLERLTKRLERYVARFRRDPEEGYGSNVWAVSGAASADGRSLLAGDGHLSLSVPSFLFQLGLDTTVFGEGDIHQLGLTVPGLPMMGLGTNGEVAWSHTQQSTDITDWYAEELQLDDAGLPKATMFQGEWKPVQAFEETFEVADIEVLGSVGRTEKVTRWTTFDGRWIAEIEGRSATKDEELAPGESLVNLGGDLVVPGDEDGDGVVSAISFDYTGFDSTGFAGGIDAMGHASTVDEFHEAQRGLNAYTQNFIVADQAGSILYSGYQGTPCRGYLERNPDGTWTDGSDPSFLLDGTKYGGFEVPMKDGKTDEAPGQTDPYRCIVPFDAYPTEKDPAQGYLANANNDPGGMTFDSDLSNDEWYIGGPFDGGIRVSTISGKLEEAVTDGTADIAKMQAIQANTQSRLGEWFSPYLVAAIEHARTLSMAPGGQEVEPWEQRLVDLYLADSDGMDEVQQRMLDWAELDFWARSGVETFYSTPGATDGDASVATMIFGAWVGAMMNLTFGDEGLPGVWRQGGTDGRIQTLLRMLEGRGADNPKGFASFNEETGESVFFDVLSTPEVERSDEVMLLALAEALEYLRGKPSAPDKGGFGTDDMSQWLWGLRHQVRFESILSEFLDAGSSYAFLADMFAIDTAVLPLADDIPAGDPRKGLRWFPRHGDQDNVDAGNPGLGGKEFTYGSGPVMRMVVALGGGNVEGQNIVPGGQSGLTDSPHFHDQLELWLGNKTYPMRFFVGDVVDGATTREELVPAP